MTILEHIGFILGINCFFWPMFCIWYNKDWIALWPRMFTEWSSTLYKKYFKEEAYYLQLERKRELALGPYLREKHAKKIMNSRMKKKYNNRFASRVKWHHEKNDFINNKTLHNPDFTIKYKERYRRALADPWLCRR